MNDSPNSAAAIAVSKATYEIIMQHGGYVKVSETGDRGVFTGRSMLLQPYVRNSSDFGKEEAKETPKDALTSVVEHPDYYGGKDNPYEAIKVIDAWGLGFCLGNAVKYISRAGKKLGNNKLIDLRKAVWYLQHEIEKGDK